MPKEVKEREMSLINSLRSQIADDPDVRTQFDYIVSNGKIDFHTKIDMLKDLSNYLKKKVENERQLAVVRKRVREINTITEEIEETNQQMANQLNNYQFESKYG
jgi:hypothetical protein